MTTLFLDLARNVLAVLFLVYTVVAITHYVLQLRYAHATYRRQRDPAFAETYPDLPIAVDIIIPVYNEEPDLLAACIDSALSQDHPGRIQVIVVDDGSPNRALMEPIYSSAEAGGAIVIRSPRNVGKRHAQALALPRCAGDIVVTLDSDSVLAADAVRRLTRQFVDPRVGAATGFVDVSNDRLNLLTKIQRVRYWMAFNQERAAQTAFRTVMCCSGPLAAYRTEVLRSVADAYLNQRYGGVDCTYGDDRHLTNLVLGQGYDTVFDSGAVAYTNVPTSLRQFLRQQLRWNKSFYRELVWTLPFLSSRPWYTRFDVASQVMMPVMLTVTAASAIIVGTLGSPLYLLRYLVMIAIAAAIRATYAAWRERDAHFYLFILYGYMSAFLLMSVRLVALSTLTDARWGTRGPEPTNGTRARILQASPMVPAMAGASAGATAGVIAAPVAAPVAAAPATPFDGAWRAGLVERHMMQATPMDVRPVAAVAPILEAPLFDVVGPPQASWPTCSSCRYPVPRTAAFCRRCGSALQLPA